MRWNRWAYLLALIPLVAGAQGTKSDYQRANSLNERTADTVIFDRIKATWIAGGESFWYEKTLPGERREFIVVHAATGERRSAPDRVALRALLPADTDHKTPPGQLELTEPHASKDGGARTTITFVNRTNEEARCFWIASDGGQRAYATLKPGETFEQSTFAGHVWIVKTTADRVLGVFEATDGGGSVFLDPSPAKPSPPAKPDDLAQVPNSSEWGVLIQDHNLFIKHHQTMELVQLTHSGSPEASYSAPFHWSSDGRKLIAYRAKANTPRKIHLVESSPKDQLQPRLHTLEYPKAGDERHPPKPCLFDIAERRAIPVADALFSNAWSISEPRWAPDSSEFYFLYNERGHQRLRLLGLDAKTGAVRTVLEEQSSTFIDYSQKTFLHWLDDTGELIWMSERDGWNHLWLYDASSGTVKNQITRGKWVVRKVERVDKDRRQIWLAIAGQRPGEDPYHVHLARVNFDGTGLVVLTDGDGTHRWEFSPDRRHFLDTWSRIDKPPTTELRRADDGALICLLEEADATALLTTGWRPAERFVAKARDGHTDIHGILTRPSNFDPSQKYPVIECIYAGPHGAFVPKEWSRETRIHALAELGFIVVQIDGMGTNWRSKAFHAVAWRNVADSGFPDRIAWLQAAARKFPEIDLSRVGIFGGSAGGQSALAALLHHGDFYQAAAADCGCHDNRMDKIWWNEAWLGWPVGPHYAENSNVTHAHKLRGKLLLTVGELDRNVDPASTMQVVDALIKADKDFELLVVPGGGHGIGETPYAARRRMDFFVRHLHKVEPRASE